MKWLLSAISLSVLSLGASEIKAPSTVSIKITVSGDNLTEHVQHATQEVARAAQHVQTHKWRIVGIGLSVLYACACYRVQRAQWLMNDLNAWLNWNAALPLEQLLAQPHQEIYVALKKAIEDHYQSPSLPIMVNVTQFLNETNAELAHLRGYVRVCAWLEKIPWALTLCFADQASIRRAHDSIKRLIFLRSVIAQELVPHDTMRRIALINFA